MREERVEFFCGDIKLEGVLEPGSGASPESPGPGVVLCHPHPLYGGRMDNNVTQAVSLALAQQGITALRFNFRGVEGSEGSFDEGRGESSDALAALDYLASRKEVDSSRLGLMGYSFGGAVALSAALYSEQVKAVAAVSPAGLPTFGDDSTPRLILCGSEDEIIPCEAILAEEEDICGPQEEGAVEMVKGVDHFWWGHEEEVGKYLSSFFQKHL